MDVSNPRDDPTERNRGIALVPLSMVIPRVGNAHLQQNPISDSYIALNIAAGSTQIMIVKIPGILTVFSLFAGCCIPL